MAKGCDGVPGQSGSRTHCFRICHSASSVLLYFTQENCIVKKYIPTIGIFVLLYCQNVCPFINHRWKRLDKNIHCKIKKQRSLLEMLSLFQPVNSMDFFLFCSSGAQFGFYIKRDESLEYLPPFSCRLVFKFSINQLLFIPDPYAINVSRTKGIYFIWFTLT